MFVLIFSALLSLLPSATALPAGPTHTQAISTAAADSPLPTPAPNDQPVAHP